jgi:hypothetical protein
MLIGTPPQKVGLGAVVSVNWLHAI